MYKNLDEIPNFKYFRGELGNNLSQILESAHIHVGLIVLNIQGFRNINIMIGHAQGDNILLELANRIQSILRDNDRVYRLGSDEFAVVLDRLRTPQVISLAANRILALLSETFNVDEQHLRVHVRMGAALFPDHAKNMDSLLRHADQALAASILKNKPFTLYSDLTPSKSTATPDLESEIEGTISANAFMLYYQPKIDLNTGKICGAEALARWHHPKRGLIYPDQFIAVIEKSSLVMLFTEWVLNEGLRECAHYQQEWDSLSIAINLSANTLQHPEIVGTVSTSMEIWGASPEQVVLEVTESAMMLEPERAMHTLQALTALCTRIAIDDFGTGYCSLAYLRHLPVQELKIDKSFVLNMDKSEDDEKIVRSVIDLGHNFGLKVIAEGVENQATFDRLKELGCDQAQGYYMARPMPADDLRRWMTSGSYGLVPIKRHKQGDGTSIRCQ